MRNFDVFFLYITVTMLFCSIVQNRYKYPKDKLLTSFNAFIIGPMD